jgi:methylated-DNA-protein-cysteine methyltransferase-like protein
VSGTVFGAFYDVVRRIPAGSVSTYGQVARLAGMPRSARLVGYAMASCQDPTVPCHRVVGADGSLTGYAGGLERKRRLLDLEAAGRTCPDQAD